MNNILKLTLSIVSVTLSIIVSAEENLPILTGKDGCSGGHYVYKAGDRIRSGMSLRDPITHKMVMKDDPEGIRMECVKDEKTGQYRWESIDKMIDGKLVRAPGFESFVNSKPSGIPKGITKEEIELGIKENRFCLSEDGVSSIGAVMPSVKGDKFYRCVKIYDEKFNVKGAGWIELVFKNGELVTTPI
jgi:hypothetical protein